MHLSLFGRSFLALVSKDNASRKRCRVALAAAKKRYPNGQIVRHRSRNYKTGVRYSVVRFVVNGCTSVMYTTEK